MSTPDPRTLVDLLEHRAAATPGLAAFHWEERPVSFRALWQDVNRFAALLQNRGVAPGDRVLIALGNGPEFFTAFYGAMRAGAVAVPLYPASGADRIAALARACGACMRVVPCGAREELVGLCTVTVADSANTAPTGPFPAVRPEHVAFLQYTSGSTGTPKGVMLTHHGLLTNIGQLTDAMAITSSDCFVSWLPVYHDMGLILMTMVPFYLGAPLFLLRTALANPRPWLDAIARHRGTLTAAPDFAYRLTLRHVRDRSAYDLSSLRVALNAAEPVRPRTIADFERAFGLHGVVIAGYGLAEATVGVSTWTPGRAPLVDEHGIVCVGRPFHGIDVRIVDGGGPVRTGSIGEIVVRSPANTPGYYGEPDETARLFWNRTYVRTGDLGYLDDEGRLFVTGRLKNVIKHGGEAIFPQEVEQIADAVVPVRRSAAVGIDSGGPEGEQLFVFAEMAKAAGYGEPALHDAAIGIVQSVHAQIGIRPGRVYLLRPHAIPVTHNGKTQHAALRDQYVSGRLRTAGSILFPDY